MSDLPYETPLVCDSIAQVGNAIRAAYPKGHPEREAALQNLRTIRDTLTRLRLNVAHLQEKR